MVRGLDTTRYIIIGAHYDHLGTHNGLIFNGADDNASGVAGMIALSGKWAACSQKPACNILFAAWTAEEKGIIGSGFFARNMPFEKGSLALVINMDMISRNAPEDSTATTLSIGTLPSGEELRNLAREYNSFMHKPFILDLWDVSGHSGSDYAHFAAQKIPVMTFFSGFHEDYHSPRDIFSKTDPGKMERVLRLVNDCISGALKSSAKTGSKL
jgi:Zn-dependent M28 family amino/carboxypeptidase